jgi:AcrR family transcriptional regulator
MPTETFFNLPAEKRARIVDAALDEFADYPYEAASISRLVARADIAKGSFYQYFESKLDLFEWLLFDEIVRQKIDYIQTHLETEPGADFFRTLESYVYAGLRFALHSPRLSRMTEALWWPSPDPDVRALAKRAQDMGKDAMCQILRSGQEAGQVRHDLDLDLAAMILTVALQQGADRALRHRYGLDLFGLMREPHVVDPVELRALVTGLVDLLRRGLGTPGGSWSPEKLDIEGLTERVLRRSE